MKEWNIKTSHRLTEMAALQACLKINPDNPQAVAEAIPLMYEVLEKSLNEIERLSMVTGYTGESHFPVMQAIKQSLTKAKEGKGGTRQC